jgi:hypothetical protein
VEILTVLDNNYAQSVGSVDCISTKAEWNGRTAIILKEDNYSPLGLASVLGRSIPNTGKRTSTIQGNKIATMSNVKGEAGVTITWGGENGTAISGYASGSASDDRGNKAGVTFEINDDGSGKASVSASHEHSSESQKK